MMTPDERVEFDEMKRTIESLSETVRKLGGDNPENFNKLLVETKQVSTPTAGSTIRVNTNLGPVEILIV